MSRPNYPITKLIIVLLTTGKEHMFNWIKHILYKIKGAQPIIGDVGLVNINPEVKFADTQNNNLIIGGNDKRNQTFLTLA